MSYFPEALWYICSMEHIVSIMQKGILCRNKANKEKVIVVDISDQSVQKRRKDYYDFTPLFFANNTSMIYVKVVKEDLNVVLLKINPEIMRKRNNVMFSDRNIACNDHTIYNDLKDLDKLDWVKINSNYAVYGNNDPWGKIRSAEVLIPDKVEVDYIEKIYKKSNKILLDPFGIKGYKKGIMYPITKYKGKFYLNFDD